MRTDVVQLLAAFFAIVTASPVTRSSHVVHERRSIIPTDWSHHSRLHEAVVLPVRIGLAQQNLHRAEEFVNEVAHPSSSKYGQHWSPRKIAEMFAPSQESIDEVKAWLSVSGIDPARISLSPSQGWISFNATRVELEYLLKTEYHTYTHTSGQKHVATEHYSIPSHLQPHIDIITPTIHFDARVGTSRSNHRQDLSSKQTFDLKKRTLATTARLGSASDASNPKQGITVFNALATMDDCDTMITPACLRALYNIPQGTLSAAANPLGIVEYTPQAFLQTDLNMFFDSFLPASVGVSPNIDLIDGATIETQTQSFGLNGESALDLEYAMTLIYPQSVNLYQVSSHVHDIFGRTVWSRYTQLLICQKGRRPNRGRLVQQLPRRHRWFILHFRRWRRCRRGLYIS